MAADAREEMKKVIKVKDLCCALCCERLSEALELKDGVLKASADRKKNAVFVETLSSVSDEFLRAAVEKRGSKCSPWKGAEDCFAETIPTAGSAAPMTARYGAFHIKKQKNALEKRVWQTTKK